MNKPTGDEALAWVEKNLPEVTLLDWQKSVVRRVFDIDANRILLSLPKRTALLRVIEEFLKLSEDEPYRCPRPECSPHDVIADPEQHKGFHQRMDLQRQRKADLARIDVGLRAERRHCCCCCND